MKCIHGFDKDVTPPIKGMHRCACCGLQGKEIYIQAGATWPRQDPLCQSCRDAEGREWLVIRVSRKDGE